ncbi:MAG: DUF1080 domain-containing protein [Planctomycetota bacterium]|nr:DUF1080 domain-containing protein [Planctomycetota bacterium]
MSIAGPPNLFFAWTVVVCFSYPGWTAGQHPAASNKGVESKPAQVAEKEKVAEKETWKDLFDGKTLKNWKVTRFGGEGEIEVKDGSIVMDYGSPITGITYTGKPPRINYEIEVEAMPIEGIDFFVGLTMPVRDSHISLIVAGWAGAVVGLSNIDDKDASENDTTKFMKFDNGKWYRVKARVESEKITCWINGKKVIEQSIKGKKIGIRPEVELSTPLGLSAFETRTAYRKIRIRSLEDSKPEKTAARK